MRRGLVSETSGGRHPNASSKGVRVSDASTPFAQGVNVGRTHEHHRGELVHDSPVYIPPPPLPTCQAVRPNGEPCGNDLKNPDNRSTGYCFGHLTKKAYREQR